MRKYNGHLFRQKGIMDSVVCKHCDSAALNVFRGKAPKNCPNNNEQKNTNPKPKSLVIRMKDGTLLNRYSFNADYNIKVEDEDGEIGDLL